MSQSNVILNILRFELAFLEDGGYGRSPNKPWQPTRIFQDSPTCLNFCEPTRPHPCDKCFLLQFVPKEKQGEGIPCRYIPLSEKGETVEYFYRVGTQIEMEEALKHWLRKEIHCIEEEQIAQAQSAKLSG
jgi:hypothetical protein